MTVVNNQEVNVLPEIKKERLNVNPFNSKTNLINFVTEREGVIYEEESKRATKFQQKTHQH